MTPKLKLIAETHRPVVIRADLHAYEHEQRRRIAGKNWAQVHVRGDKSEPLELAHRPSWKGWWK